MTRGAGEHPAGVYTAAIYGSIVSTALVAALWERHASPRTMTLSVLSTMLVFWLAHVWSAIAGERIHRGQGLPEHRIVELAREEWPMVEAVFVPIAALALAWAGVLDRDEGARAALVIGVLQLFGWGLAVGRRAYDGWWHALLGGAMNGVLGVALVALELAVIH
jgi:hypothetical protein